MRYKIFISYSTQYNWEARSIQEKLIACGAEVFLDVLDIAFGEDIEEKILDNLNSCDELWVLITQATHLSGDYRGSNIIPGSETRPYIWLETGVAWFRGIPIIPILIMVSPSTFSSNKDIPYVLRKKKAVDWTDNTQQTLLLNNIKIKVSKVNQFKERCKRCQTELPTSIIFSNSTSSKRRKGILSQISCNGKGCFISTNQPCKLNNNIQIEFKLKGKIRHQLKGAIKNGVGVEIH